MAGKQGKSATADTSGKVEAKSKSRLGRVLLVLAILTPLSLVYTPNFWWNVIILADHFTPWSSFTSTFAASYHKFLVSRLPDLEEQPLPEIDVKDASIEKMSELSNGFQEPIVIRGAALGAEALTKWTDPSFWIDQYGNESVICKPVGAAGDSNMCTVAEAFGLGESKTREYISGESHLFTKYPQLDEMVSTPFLKDLEASGVLGKKVFTHMFMGFPGQGSDIHSAIGCNVFRQVAGRKKWWLLPPHQNAYVYSSVNQNGFSSHTMSKIAIGDQEESPWVKKLERYTIVLNPGDVLINPSWWWHAILNIDTDPDALVIGVPTRFMGPRFSALKNNVMFSLLARLAVAKQFNGIDSFTSNNTNLQVGIDHARKERNKKVKV